MPLKTPLTYIRQRRDLAQASKPTAHAKLHALPVINPQTSSTLFNQIPGEIRQVIYEYALLEYPDLSRPYNIHSFHYRPGYTHARCINTSFLLSCRRVYLEAGHLAVAQNEHLIYQPVAHGPPRHRPYLLPSSKVTRRPSGPRKGLMKLELRQSVQQVHIFAQQSWLDGWTGHWKLYCMGWSQSFWAKDRVPGIRSQHPPKLKITIRHTDWWHFLLGESSPLAFDAKRAGRAPPGIWVPPEAEFERHSWGGQLKYLQGLKVFELELETLEKKRAELQAIVDNAKLWRFVNGNGETMVCMIEEAGVSTWTGSKHVYGLTSPDDRARKGEPAQGAGYVMEQDVNDLSPEERLEYVVMTLTWRAQPNPTIKGKTDGAESLVDDGNTDIPGEAVNADGDADGSVQVAPPPTPAPAPAPAPALPNQGIFVHNMALRRDAIPTYYG